MTRAIPTEAEAKALALLEMAILAARVQRRG